VSILNGASVLITGGTGSFGHRFVRTVLENYTPSRLVVFSRDELKQFEMREAFPITAHPNLRFFLGDVRDRERLYRALGGVDIVVHAAALKQVPAAEYNPLEVIKTNILGSANLIDAAIDRKVKRVIALSTDKAANPVNLYGATKLVMEKLLIQANAYAGVDGTRFSCVRYGNVVGSRGSVVPLFRAQRQAKKVTVTDPRMSRFWITLEQGVRFVISCIENMFGGEVFVPKLPSTNIMDIARVVAPECDPEIIGIRSGEKLHECLISTDESRQSKELPDRYVIMPLHTWWEQSNYTNEPCLPEGFSYSSDTNSWTLNEQEIESLLDA